MTDRLVLRYYLHRVTRTTGFFWPIFPLVLLDRGIPFAGIGTLLAVEAAVVLLVEVPTGYVGDAFGRRNSLVVGAVLLLAGELGYVFADEFPAFVLIYVCFGVGRTFQSGSGDAWLYDVLVADDREGEFTAVRGNGESVTHWASTGAMVASGLLYTVDPVAPFVAAGALTAVDVAVLLTMPSVGAARETRVAAGDLLPTLRRTITRPAVWPFVVVAAAFFGIERAVSEFVPSVTTAVLGATVAVSPSSDVDVVFVGVFFAGFTASSAVASYFTGDLEERLGAPTVLLGAGSLSALLMLVAAAVPPVALLAVAAIKTADAVLLPLVNGYVNDYVESAGRATTLSAMSMVFTLTQLPLLVAAGAVADRRGVFVAVGALGACFVVAGAVVLVASGWVPGRGWPAITPD